MAKRPSKKILEALADLAKALRQIEAPSMASIDLERVRAFVHEFAQILEAPERIPEFERLLQKVL